MMYHANYQVAAASEIIRIFNPYDGAEVGAVTATDAHQIGELLARARKGAVFAKQMPRWQRAKILETAARLVDDRAADFARLIVSEAGKTVTQARKETARCVNTLKLSAEEAKRNDGEVIPFDAYASSENRQGWFSREPLGIIAAITPYNDPLNLVAHKLGPAIAGGNAVILKPSELAPLSALRLVDTLIEAELPPEIVTTAIGGAELGAAIVGARDVRMVSFTGGFATGEAIMREAGLKKFAMDLGGNAAVIVMADCDLDEAVKSCISGAFWAAGQNCIGTQRILVQSSIYERFRGAFVAQAKDLRLGDPMREESDLGPMITEAAARRAEAVVAEAVTAGAHLLCGHQRQGTLFPATVLEHLPQSCRAWREEVFAPIVVLQPIETIDQALALANGPEFSLHMGIFTRDLEIALMAAAKLEAGGVMINDSSDYRFDAMPFGGFKYGSMGREGVRFAYEEMTQPKVVCVNRLCRT